MRRKMAVGSEHQVSGCELLEKHNACLEFKARGDQTGRHIATFRGLLRINVEVEWSTIFSAWLGTFLNRKLHIVAFALVLGFTLFAVQEIEPFDDALGDYDDALICVSIASPGTKEPPESSHSRLFRLAAPSLSSLPLLMAPVKAGRDLLNLLTLQRK